MLALGATELDRPEDLELAKELAATCRRLYAESPSGIGPEIVSFGADGTYTVTSGKYLLRPGAACGRFGRAPRTRALEHALTTARDPEARLWITPRR